MDKFHPLITEVLEVDYLVMTDELVSFDSWDSLTILSIIAMASEEFNVELTKEEIEDSKTVAGLQQLMVSKMKSR